MNKDKEMKKEWDREIMELCPILYCESNKSMQETCMCWGFECGEGWKLPLRNLSTQLELLNLQNYPKYRVRVQADQVKEKYGTLRFYFSVAIDPCKISCVLRDFFRKLQMCLRKVDYALKDVTDEPEKKYDEINELSKKDYLRLSKSKYKCINVEYAEKDGKYLEIVHMTQYRRWHHEPTKHKLLYWLMSKAQLLQSYFSYPSKTTREQEVVYDALYDIASKLIRNTESECMKTCEVCGSQIGTEWSPICQTAGWIRYICETCAKKGGRYYKDHKLYENGKLVKEASKKNSKKQSKTKE